MSVCRSQKHGLRAVIGQNQRAAPDLRSAGTGVVGITSRPLLTTPRVSLRDPTDSHGMKYTGIK
jgi:hypothetical protein